MKATDLLREGHQADVIHQSGGTSSQPHGLPRAQAELPLKALQRLRELEPFVTGQERELVGQAMADLATWRQPQPRSDPDGPAGRGPRPHTQWPGSAANAQPGHTNARFSESMWRSMVESSEGDTHEKETLILPNCRTRPTFRSTRRPHEPAGPAVPELEGVHDPPKDLLSEGTLAKSEHRRRRAHAAFMI